MKDFYVYQLIDPRNNTVFYVGKGQGNRMYQHEEIAKKGKSENRKLRNKIIKILLKRKNILYRKIFETDDEGKALLKEKEIIKKLGLENLCNVTEGGTGGDTYKNNPRLNEILLQISNSLKGRICTEETKKNISKGNLGKRRTPEQIKIMQLVHPSMEGKNNPMFAKKHKNKSKEEMSIKARQRGKEYYQRIQLARSLTISKMSIQERKNKFGGNKGKTPWDKGKVWLGKHNREILKKYGYYIDKRLKDGISMRQICVELRQNFNIKIGEGFLYRLRKHNLWFDANECKEYGLVDEIIV